MAAGRPNSDARPLQHVAGGPGPHPVCAQFLRVHVILTGGSVGPPPSRTPLGNGCAYDCCRHRGMHRLPVHTGLGHQPIPPSVDWSLPPTGPSHRWWLTHGFKWYVDKRFVCIVLCLFYCVLEEDSNCTENLLFCGCHCLGEGKI